MVYSISKILRSIAGFVKITPVEPITEKVV